MKALAVIPARYNSSRLHGKPLADIAGKPMIWHVYQKALQAKKITSVVVATDDQRIIDACETYEMNWILTRTTHETMSSRIHEVSTQIEADAYVVVNGDEPLIDPSTIDEAVPNTASFYATNLCSLIDNPADVLDVSNIKVVFNEQGKAVYMSRSPVPYPKSTITPKYYKHLGVIAYSKEALDFFANTTAGIIERVEDIDYLRFLENAKDFQMIVTKASSISVDTPKDLELVRSVFDGGEND